MPFPRAFYRAVANLSRSHPKGDDGAGHSTEIGYADYRAAADLSGSHPESGEGAPQPVEIDLADLDFDRPEEALEALRRVVNQAKQGEQLVLLRKGPLITGRGFPKPDYA